MGISKRPVIEFGTLYHNLSEFGPALFPMPPLERGWGRAVYGAMEYASCKEPTSGSGLSTHTRLLTAGQDVVWRDAVVRRREASALAKSRKNELH